MTARRPDGGRDPFATPPWFVAFFALLVVVGIGMLGLLGWALVRVVLWLTS